MKAIILKNYGLPSLLKLEEVPKPAPKDSEVLVKIYASSINDSDWGLIRGKPLIIRFFFGFKKPKVRIPGVDISGRVESVGAKVSHFKRGDDVFADLSDCGFGAFAQYVAIPEKILHKKPENIDYNLAAALPHASLLALQALVNKGKVKSGQRILINGAGGGVGTIGIQILRSYDNLHITGVDSEDKFDLMKSLGFDEVIDYKTVDFTKTGKKYDLILDAKSNRSVFKYAKALNKNGTYITVGGSMRSLIQIAAIGSFFYNKKLAVLSLQPNQGLNEISRLVENRQIIPVIDGPYAFELIPEMIQYFADGRHLGKIVIDHDFNSKDSTS